MVCLIAGLCCGMWLASPAYSAVARPVEMMEYAATLVVGASALYCFSVLLATFLDDQWRAWGSMIGSAAVWWLSIHTPLPASINISRYARGGAHSRTHDAEDCDGLLSWLGRDSILCGAENCANPRILIVVSLDVWQRFSTNEPFRPSPASAAQPTCPCYRAHG